MIKIQSLIYQGSNGRSSQFDIRYSEEHKSQKLVVFCHGYKGFKDWGAWNQVADQFVENGYAFLKFNFSHNGGTAENGIDFPDLDAFSENNYSKELKDLSIILDIVKGKGSVVYDFIDFEEICLIGHSRGGAIALLYANSHKNIKKLVTWAAVSDFESRFPKGEELEIWRMSETKYVRNARTKQNMPLDFQFYEDFQNHKDQLNISMAAKYLKIPYLILHGESDQSVLLEEAKNIHGWAKNSILKVVKDTNHTFNIQHPWQNESLSKEMQEVLDETIEFIG